MFAAIRRKTAVALTATALTAGLAVAAAPSASAGAAGYDRCPAGSSCHFSDDNGNGDLWIAPGTGCYDLGHWNPPFNDRISSAFNRSNQVVHMYNWTGSYWQWVADVQVGEQWSLGGHDSRNDIIDAVCVGRTP